MKSNRYLTTEEVAAMLHLSKATLERWRRQGDGPPFVRAGRRRVLYPADGVDRWLADNPAARDEVPS